MTALDKRQYNLLKLLEWHDAHCDYYPIKRSCPICEAMQPNHSPDCELHAALGNFQGSWESDKIFDPATETWETKTVTSPSEYAGQQFYIQTKQPPTEQSAAVSTPVEPDGLTFYDAPHAARDAQLAQAQNQAPYASLNLCPTCGAPPDFTGSNLNGYRTYSHTATHNWTVSDPPEE